MYKESRQPRTVFMSVIESLVGTSSRNTLLRHIPSGGLERVEIGVELANKPFAVYCSASWCPPCVRFTPVLVDFYLAVKEKGLPFEIVFCSLDKNEESFLEYYKKMPWLAIDFEDEINATKFNVYSVPTLILYDAQGKMIANNAVDLVRTGQMSVENYPWAALKGKDSQWCSTM